MTKNFFGRSKVKELEGSTLATKSTMGTRRPKVTILKVPVDINVVRLGTFVFQVTLTS